MVLIYPILKSNYIHKDDNIIEHSEKFITLTQIALSQLCRHLMKGQYLQHDVGVEMPALHMPQLDIDFQYHK
jgi:hypothetical protein